MAKRRYKRNRWAFANACTTLSGLFLKSQERKRKIELQQARLKLEAERLEAQRIKNARAALEAENAELKNALTASQVALAELRIEKERRELGLDSPEFDPLNYES